MRLAGNDPPDGAKHSGSSVGVEPECEQNQHSPTIGLRPQAGRRPGSNQVLNRIGPLTGTSQLCKRRLHMNIFRFSKKQRSLLRTLILLLAILNLAYLASAETAGPPMDPQDSNGTAMPELVYDAADQLRFVAANRVLLRSGEVDPALFDEVAVDRIRDLLALPVKANDDCVRLEINSSEEIPEGTRSLSQLMRQKENAVVAVVTGSAVGFRRWDPGTLLRLHTLEVLKGEKNRPLNYIFLPAGEVEVGRFRLCRTTTGVPDLPVAQDRVLILYDNLEMSERSPLMEFRAYQMIILPTSKPVRFSSYLSLGPVKKDTERWAGEAFLEFARREVHLVPEGGRS